MEQILTLQEEFNQVILWTKEMFLNKNEEIIDEFTGTMSFSISLDFEFARFKNENNPFVQCYDSIIFTLFSYNGEIQVSTDDDIATRINLLKETNEYGRVKDIGKILIKNDATGKMNCWYIKEDNSILKNGWEIDSNDANEQKVFIDTVLNGKGSKVRVDFYSKPYNQNNSSLDSIDGEIIEARSVNRYGQFPPSITLCHFYNILEIIKLYADLFEKTHQRQPLIDSYLETLPPTENERITQLIDDEYDYLKGIYDSYNSVTTAHEETIKKYNQQIASNVNIEDINILEQVVNKYNENPWIKNLTTYCRENQIRNENVKWLEKIKNNYRILDINNDITRSRPSGCLLFFVNNNKPEFGEETKRFISDFKKHFNAK